MTEKEAILIKTIEGFKNCGVLDDLMRNMSAPGVVDSDRRVYESLYLNLESEFDKLVDMIKAP